MSPPLDDVITGTPLFLDAVANDPDAAAAADIPVERIAGPILAVTGDDDRMWPAAALIERARRRAEAHGFG